MNLNPLRPNFAKSAVITKSMLWTVMLGKDNVMAVKIFCVKAASEMPRRDNGSDGNDGNDILPPVENASVLPVRVPSASNLSVFAMSLITLHTSFLQPDQSRLALMCSPVRTGLSATTASINSGTDHLATTSADWSLRELWNG